jgi:hypothetical protein
MFVICHEVTQPLVTTSKHSDQQLTQKNQAIIQVNEESLYGFLASTTIFNP